MKRQNSQSGAIAIEASIVLTLFIFFVITMYSFFMVFEVQGKISSTIIQSAQSLSLDSYSTDRTHAEFGDKDSPLLKLLTSFGIEKSVKSDGYITTSDGWYKTECTATTNAELAEVIKARFIAYLTNEGTETAADELLKKLKVENGISGLDFSESSIDSEGNINIVVKYKVNYVFDCPTIDLKPFEFSHKTTSHLWRDAEVKYVAPATEVTTE